MHVLALAVAAWAPQHALVNNAPLSYIKFASNFNILFLT